MYPAHVLKRLTKEAVAALLYKIMRRGPLGFMNCKDGSPTILYYHRVCDWEDDSIPLPDLVVSKTNFEKQIEFIKSEFNVLPLDVIVDHLSQGKKLSYRDVAVTFDDGYLDNYSVAYPILKRYNVPATIFLTTGHMGSNRLFWWDRLALIIEAMRGREICWEDFPSPITPEFCGLLKNATVIGAYLTPLTNYLKWIGTEKRGKLMDYLDLNFSDGASLSSLPRLFLSWEEVKKMSGDLVTFGSHSHNHPVLTETTDEEMVQELIHSKEIIAENIGAEVKAFAYPDGCFDERVKKKVAEAGYRYAVQTSRSIIKDLRDIYAIPRKAIKENHSHGYFEGFSEALFAIELSGIFDSVSFRQFRRINPYEN